MNQKPSDQDTKLRPHTYDGIQEYDNRLPNWWLWTFYLAVIFSFLYWFIWADTSFLIDDETSVEQKIAEIEAIQLAAVGELNNDVLWAMSKNPTIVTEGKVLFEGKGTCFTCHGLQLEGGTGLNLVDQTWKWGNQPMSVYTVVSQGSPDTSKGMISWMNQLGPDGIKKIVAYILSHHSEESMQNAASENPPIGL